MDQRHCSPKRARRRRLETGRRQKARDFVYNDRISRGCSRCPEKRPGTLDYHHRDPSVKKTSISRLVSKGQLGALRVEVLKCVLLCANCHRVETNGDGYRN
jgi:hypothetical protein